MQKICRPLLVRYSVGGLAAFVVCWRICPAKLAKEDGGSASAGVKAGFDPKLTLK